MLITSAWAQGAGSSVPGGDLVVQLLPFAFIFVILYVLILRPQQKRMKQQQEMLANLRRGDTVVTAGGLIGKIAKVGEDNDIQVDIADNVRVRILRQMIAEVRSKGEPVKDN
ncbi:preprotein translocase subunit YajC [Candidatus Raskinella chloraquaticus]|jgi:preprotein translocase subunit YajC|uniref:Sec translocon accessory complex subunit YajC n=1 Tax=Candidatus Raskinella chloraquaticus TaxID=1951219 RepID=A0A1W9I1G3_9HYPH|nr:MAG: preprotein translocase subunit YajC [Proteobacteria bacterium SG_bin8]OQW83275.1 MAG: preprotein translocase subunit YajC [Proteobacteria bacterium ST_bin15]